MGQAEPGQLFAELRQEVVCDEPHHPSQDVQDETESRLKSSAENTLKPRQQFTKNNNLERTDLLQ